MNVRRLRPSGVRKERPLADGLANGPSRRETVIGGAEIREFCIRRGYSDRRRLCRLSVRMYNLLLSDCGCPGMLSSLPDRVAGLLKIWISEHPYSDGDQFGALLGFPENRSPAFWTKVECDTSTAIGSTRILFGDALGEPDLLSRIECLNTESASRTALAFEAVAYGDADGVASNRYLELSATACGFAIRHVDYLSTETHNWRPCESTVFCTSRRPARAPLKSLQKSSRACENLGPLGGIQISRAIAAQSRQNRGVQRGSLGCKLKRRRFLQSVSTEPGKPMGFDPRLRRIDRLSG
jgi:hypothetical protein